jgi:uncharacterized protein YndB with AHSA1/START domain
MAVDVVTEIVIRRPRAEVATYAANPDNAPRWYANIEPAEWQTPPPLGIGSRITFVAHFLGRELVYTYEVSDYVPGERLVLRTASGPFPMETTYAWESAPGGATRMTLRNRGAPSGFSRLMAPLMAPMIRRENRKDLARLKQMLEQQGPS